jgi:hypothetical protein
MPIELGSFSLGLFTGTLLGVLVGALLGHWLARARGREDRLAAFWNAECSYFREPFLEALTILNRSEDVPIVASVLETYFAKHELAYNRFVRNLQGKHRRRLETRWNEYKQYYTDTPKELTARVFAMGSPEQEAKHRDIMCCHMRHLLSFAKET